MDLKDIPTCEVCGKRANQTCGGCKLVYYCSRGHQKIGWREGHKYKCCAFKIQFNDTLGRHMVATRDIKAGETILKEKPAVYGPRMSSVPHCLSCNSRLQPMKMEGNVYDFYKCSSCKWPMCGANCEKAAVHREECKLMTEKKYKCSIKYEDKDKQEAAYCVIAPLRVLLMKESNPMQFENVLSLEHHLEERINTPLYKILKANLCTFIIQVMGMQFDEETILKVSSIYDTNSFDVRSPDGKKRMRAIYVTASMMNHSCKPNTRHIFLGDDYNFALIATVPIAKGELITVTYTQSLWGTLDRRRHLSTTKCFECSCERCRDPTEFGTYMGNIYCSLCNGPGSENNANRGAMMVSVDTLDESANFKCEKCDHVILSRQMFWGNNALKEELNKINKQKPQDYEEFISRYSRTVHPINQHVIQAKLALIQLYGNTKEYSLADLSDTLLRRKIELCNELLEVADKVEPGMSKFRATLLLELQAALTLQTKREFDTEKITKAGAQDQLMESMKYLQEATAILKVEPSMKDELESRITELADLLEDKYQDDNEQNGSDSISVD